MSPARSAVPSVLRALGGLPLLPLLWLVLPSAPAVRGDCGLPQDIPNAQPALGGLTSFPHNTTVTFKCDKGFIKVPGRADSVVCLANDQWSDIPEFCNRSCTVPTRLLSASLKREYNKQNYFPVGTVVEYECRPGYRRDRSQSAKITCLQDLEWSEPAEFCKKKSCPNPGELRNGNVNIPTDILFGSLITFSCDIGYTLVGATSSYCIAMDNSVGWSDPLPDCIEIHCTEPPKIENGEIRDELDVYVYRQTVTYECARGFTLVGKSSIYCTVKDNLGEWSDPPPECRGKVPPQKPTVNVPGTKVIPTPQKTTIVNVTPIPLKPTTVNVPGTKILPTPKKTTTMNVPGTKILPVPQKPTTVNVPGTKVTPTPQKPTTENVPGTKVTPTPQKSTTENVPGTGVTPTPQKPTTENVPDTEVTPTPQKPTTENVPSTKVLPTPRNPITVNVPDTEVTPTPQKLTTVNVPDIIVPPTSQKLTTVNISATRVLPIPQKSTTVNITDTEVPPTLQKLTTVNIPSTEVPPTPQKPTIANSSATKAPGTAQTSPISKAISTKTPPAAQGPIMTHASATQTTAATQRVTTAKASFTQSFPATRKSTIVYVPGTQGLRVTQRLTSARIPVTHGVPPAMTTRKSHTASSPEGKGESSGTIGLIYGKFGSQAIKRNCHHCGMYNPYSRKRILSFNCLRKIIKMRCLWVPKRKRMNAFYRRVLWTPLGFVAAAIIIATLILVKIFWDCGKSGSYSTNENSKAHNVMLHNLSETGGFSEDE